MPSGALRCHPKTASPGAALGPEVHDPIGALHDVEVVLEHLLDQVAVAHRHAAGGDDHVGTRRGIPQGSTHARLVIAQDTEIQYLDADGRLQTHQFTGSRDEIRDQILRQQGLPQVERDQLLDALSARDNVGPMVGPLGRQLVPPPWFNWQPGF